MSLPSKRAFLASVTNPATGEPFAKADTVGKFSKAANEYAAANPTLWAEAAPVVKTAKVAKPAFVKPVTVKASTATRPSTFDPKAVRKWAETEGLIEKGKRGRLPGTVIAKFLSTDGAQVAERAPRPTPLLMPKRRPQNTGFTVTGKYKTLIRQSECGNCRIAISRCACPEPRAYKWLEKENGGPLVLTLDKPSA